MAAPTAGPSSPAVSGLLTSVGCLAPSVDAGNLNLRSGRSSTPQPARRLVAPSGRSGRPGAGCSCSPSEASLAGRAPVAGDVQLVLEGRETGASLPSRGGRAPPPVVPGSAHPRQAGVAQFRARPPPGRWVAGCGGGPLPRQSRSPRLPQSGGSRPMGPPWSRWSMKSGRWTARLSGPSPSCFLFR